MKKTLAIMQHRIEYLESTLACLRERSDFNEPHAKGYRLGKEEMIQDELDYLSKILEDIANNFHWIDDMPIFSNKKIGFIHGNSSSVRGYIPMRNQRMRND
jgi:hypothetical protein